MEVRHLELLRELAARGTLAEVARIPDRATAEACFGTPVTAGDRTVIPVADVSYGFGFAECEQLTHHAIDVTRVIHRQMTLGVERQIGRASCRERV